MSEEDKRLLEQTSKDVSHLKKQVEELIFVLTGGIHNEGLITRLHNAETKREQQIIKDVELKENLIRDNSDFKHFMMIQLDAAEGSLDKKFSILKSDIENKFVEISKFKDELIDFKRKLEIYMNILTGKSTWAFIFKISAFLIGLSTLFYGLWKGGYDFIIKFFKYINQ